jgi:hypothetical protein
MTTAEYARNPVKTAMTTQDQNVPPLRMSKRNRAGKKKKKSVLLMGSVTALVYHSSSDKKISYGKTASSTSKTTRVASS